jgi:hypothetical protein
VRPQRAATLRRGGAVLAEATLAIEARFAEPNLAIGDVAREIATSGRPLQRVFAEVAEPTFQTRPQSGGVGPVTPAAFDPAALGRRPVRPRALRTLLATGDFDGEAVGASPWVRSRSRRLRPRPDHGVRQERMQRMPHPIAAQRRLERAGPLPHGRARRLRRSTDRRKLSEARREIVSVQERTLPEVRAGQRLNPVGVDAVRGLRDGATRSRAVATAHRTEGDDSPPGNRRPEEG